MSENTPKGKHIVLYSGGLVSWRVAKYVIDKYGKDDVILLFTDTKIEDPDLYRFLDETEAHFGVEITKLVDGRDPWEVFRDVKFIGNSRVDPCSNLLKRVPTRRWLKENANPETDVIYLGFDMFEDHRFKRALKHWDPWTIEAPLVEEVLETRKDIEAHLAKIGIEIPELYKKGFSHNNCFTGDTEFITDTGIKTLKECLGQDVKVLGSHAAWRDAQVKSFGVQKLVELKLTRYNQEKTILTTEDHLWFKRIGRVKGTSLMTRDLQEGDWLVSNFPKGEEVLRDWKVKSITPLNREEEVFCAVVPEGHVFTLVDNILTHNCGGFCVKAGQGHFKMLYETKPDLYLYHEEKEEEMRQYLDKDVSILVDRRGGGRKPLTLKMLRERIEEEAMTDFEVSDIRGCGCFSPDVDYIEDEVPEINLFDLFNVKF